MKPDKGSLPGTLILFDVLWPLGLIVSGIFAVPPILAARFGAFIHRHTAREEG
jgi:hypothetical protein